MPSHGPILQLPEQIALLARSMRRSMPPDPIAIEGIEPSFDLHQSLILPHSIAMKFLAAHLEQQHLRESCGLTPRENGLIIR